MSRAQFDKGEVVAIYGILIFGVSALINMLFAIDVINTNVFLYYTSIFCTIASYPVIGYGCFFMAKGKGYHPAIGLVLSIILIGPILLSYLPYRKVAING